MSFPIAAQNSPTKPEMKKYSSIYLQPYSTMNTMKRKYN